MKSYFDVILIGNYNIDLVFTGLSSMPKMGMEVRSKSFELIPGESYTYAAVMHRLGMSVGWAADFGSDELSQLALKFIRAENLDESLFSFHSFALRRLSAAVSTDQDRSFITYFDIFSEEDAFQKTIQNITGKIFMVPGLSFLPEIQKHGDYCKKNGIKIYLDANMSNDITLDNKELQKVIPLVDVLLPNSREVKVLSGETNIEKGIQRLAQYFPLVVAKDGANGSYACDGNNLIHVPSIDVKAVDTTGAGDCFDCGFIKALLENYSIEDCLKWGNIVGAISTQALGGSGRIITVDEVKRIYSEIYSNR